MLKTVLLVSTMILPLLVLSCMESDVSNERTTTENVKKDGFGLSQASIKKLSNYLVVFDFDDTLYMNGDRNPSNVVKGWSNYSEDAIKYLHKNGINIAICSKNSGSNLPSTLRKLNLDSIFNDSFFNSIAFLDGTPDSSKGGRHCSNPKDQGVKDIIEYFNIKSAKNVLMFDDSSRNKDDIEDSSKVTTTGVEVQEIAFVKVEKREESSDFQNGGGVTEEQFKLGLSKLGLLDSRVSLLGEGEGDCDNSRECSGDLVCVNEQGQREEADSNEHGFTFTVENDVKQDGVETCQQPEIAQPSDELPDGVSYLEEGEGDCDNSKECAGDLVCLNENGKREEADSNEHGFIFEIENDVKQAGSETCQQPETLPDGVTYLQEGEGDCDNSKECAGDLVCLNENGKREEADSNEHGFIFEIENDVKQDGAETCEYPSQEAPEEEEEEENNDDIKNASDTLVVKSNNQWYFVYCSGQDVKISKDINKKQTWVKSGTRNIRLLNGPKLYCPERAGGYAPTACKCSSSNENYHEKRKADDSMFKPNVAAPAKITTDEEIFIGPNNNMNACLKVVKKKSDGSLRIHAPCALEPWKTRQKCKKEGDYNLLSNDYSAPDGSNKSVHDLDCNEFRLNR